MTSSCSSLFGIWKVLFHAQSMNSKMEGEKLIRANTGFALDLFKVLSHNKNGDNVFLSPLSISTALAMTYLGARSKTAEQMADVLKFGEVNPDHLHSSFSDLGQNLLKFQGYQILTNLRQLLVGDDNFTLLVANKLYGQEGYNFLQEFLGATRKYYGAELEQVDFIKDAERSRQTVNKWVESQTKEKIKDLLPDGSIDDMTRLILVNAIYFKGDWNLKFNPDHTQDDDFTLADGTKSKVPLMHMKKKFNYGISEGLNVQALELPYKGEKLSMVILLPKLANGITDLEKKLTADHLIDFEKTFNVRSKIEVNVYLPRFKMEDSFDLGDTLSSMGMIDAFNIDRADFSGMNGERDLYISKVFHKTFLEVNEEGSEAAAATAVVMARSASFSVPEQFRADHPFMFFIRENETKAVLFLGKFCGPDTGIKAKSEL